MAEYASSWVGIQLNNFSGHSMVQLDAIEFIVRTHSAVYSL
jgi:hypothetical protein